MDEGDDEEKCTVIVALMQKNRRAQRKIGIDCMTIGFAMYHVRITTFHYIYWQNKTRTGWDKLSKMIVHQSGWSIIILIVLFSY